MAIDFPELQSGTAAGFWIRFVLAVLATWRVSHLLVSEDGPWNLLARLRQRLNRTCARRGHERSEHAVDNQVRRDERRPVGQLARDHEHRVTGVQTGLLGTRDAELVQDRVRRTRVTEFVLSHRGRRHCGLDRRRAHGPFAIAPPERALVVGERSDQRDHRRGGGIDAQAAHALIASRIEPRGTMIISIQGCSS